MSDDQPRERLRDLQHPPDPQDAAYWLSRTPQERLAAVEALRRRIHGDDYAAGGIARVARIIRLGDLEREQASDPDESRFKP